MTPDRAPDVLLLDFDPERAPNARYVDLHNLLHNDAGRRVARRKVQNNTYAERMADQFGRPAIGVRFHDTFVVVNSAHTITLDTGGFGTATTLDRINRYTPDVVNVHTEKGSWFVRTSYGNVPFMDGMTLHWDAGWTFSPTLTDVVAEMTAHNKAIRITVEAWLNAMPTGLADTDNVQKFYGHTPCASCCYVDRQKTRTIADEFENSEHLLRHMLDHEWPYELIAVAMREARMVPVEGLWPHNFAYDDGLRHQSYLAIKKALRHYVLSRLLTGVLTRSGYAPKP